MLLRRATSADIDSMHRVRMSVRENRLSDPSRVRVEDYAALLNERGCGWVAVDANGGIIGFAVIDWHQANVWALFVAPHCEGRGVGRRLHDTMLEHCFGPLRLERLWLSTEAGTRAERFYRAAGWRRAGDSGNGELRFELVRQQWRGGD